MDNIGEMVVLFCIASVLFWLIFYKEQDDPMKEMPTHYFEDPIDKDPPLSLMVDSPLSFDDFIGQKNKIELLKMTVHAAVKEDKTVPHILLTGPGGTGKTTLASCIANEISTNFYITTPSTFKDKDAIHNFFFDKEQCCKLEEGDIVFIDEIHRVREAVAIYLYSIMQDNYMDVGEGQILETPPITFVGATTDSGMLASPFRDRFKINLTLNEYGIDDLSTIVEHFKKLPKEVSDEIAKRACGIPRKAKSIAENTINYAIFNDIEPPTIECVYEVCKLLEIDEDGLCINSRRVIEYFQKNENKPVGLASLAGALNISRVTMEEEVFPSLFSSGLLQSNGTRGRSLSPKGVEYNANIL